MIFYLWGLKIISILVEDASMIFFNVLQIWRIVVTMFLATILSRTTHYDPNLYDIVLITLLTYIQVALITNLFFIIGIQKVSNFIRSRKSRINQNSNCSGKFVNVNKYDLLLFQRYVLLLFRVKQLDKTVITNQRCLLFGIQ